MRIYLVNVTEFDPINSFHLHANFFDYYDTGTTLTPTLAHRRSDHAMPGAARHPRVQLRRARRRHVHVPCAPVRIHRTRLGRHVRRTGARSMSEQLQQNRPALIRLGCWCLLPLAAMLGVLRLDRLARSSAQFQQWRPTGRGADGRTDNSGRDRHRAVGARRWIRSHGHRAGGGGRCVLDFHARPARTDCARRCRLAADSLSLGSG